MRMKIDMFLVTLSMCISIALANYGDIRIKRSPGDDSDSGLLEFQLNDGTWGAVCSSGFDSLAAKVSCKQLGYDNGYSSTAENDHRYDDIPSAVCSVNCNGYESKLEYCYPLRLCSNHEGCIDNVILTCYYDSSHYHYSSRTDYSSDGGPSTGSVVGAIVGGIFIFVLVFFIVACRIYVRYSYMRRNRNHSIVATQRRTPRVFIARVTCTASSGPPPPPAYTPSAPDAGYTAVPPKGYQSVPTTDYSPAQPTNTLSVAPDDIPSDPPPEYTPTISTNVPMPAPPVNQDSTQ